VTVLPQDEPGAKDLEQVGGIILAKKAAPGTPFDYLLPDLEKKADAHIPGDPAAVTAALKVLHWESCPGVADQTRGFADTFLN